MNGSIFYLLNEPGNIPFRYLLLPSQPDVCRIVPQDESKRDIITNTVVTDNTFFICYIFKFIIQKALKYRDPYDLLCL